MTGITGVSQPQGHFLLSTTESLSEARLSKPACLGLHARFMVSRNLHHTAETKKPLNQEGVTANARTTPAAHRLFSPTFLRAPVKGCWLGELYANFCTLAIC